MSDALITFTRILAWAALVWCGLTLFTSTVGRWLETEADRCRDRSLGRTWCPRGPFIVGLGVAGAWLYASWPAP